MVVYLDLNGSGCDCIDFSAEKDVSEIGTSRTVEHQTTLYWS